MYELLAATGRIGGLTLKNRFIQAPLHTMLADPSGRVTSEQCAYYEKRALGGAALLITEYGFVDNKASQANICQLGLYDDAFLPGLARLAETIHHAGALAGVQISHAGRQRFLGRPPIVAPSRVPWEALHATGAPVPLELSIEEIAEIVTAFGHAARRVKQAGFDLVELHAAHGYLVGQFLSQLTNRRTDLYGGDLASRQRFLREVVRAMRRAVGDEHAITVRLSASEYEPGGISLEETVATARMLEAEGIAALDISAGNHQTMDTQIQPTYAPLATNAGAAAEVKNAVEIPVSVVGSITDPQVAEEILQKGAADFIRLGRPLLADPEYPRKVFEGRADQVRPCIRCNDCVDRAVLQRRSIRCSVNFGCGRESVLSLYRPAMRRLRIAVVGAGPAGLEASCVAAEAGYDVVLFEREELGGSLNAIGRPEFKADLLRYRDYLVGRARKTVEIRQTEATEEELARAGPELVILATGAQPRGLEAVADGSVRLVDSRKALSAPDVIGEDVVVDGGGQFAAEVAWYLAAHGKRVTIVAAEPALAADVGSHTSRPLLARLDELGVAPWLGCRLVTLTSGSCVAMGADGRPRETVCDSVVTTRYEPLEGLITSLSSGPWRILKIGDCAEPRRILDAVEDANVAVARL